MAGELCSVLPGALVDAVRGHDGLEALPLTGPVLTTPIGFMSHRQVQPTRALDAAQLFDAATSGWLLAETKGIHLPYYFQAQVLIQRKLRLI